MADDKKPEPPVLVTNNDPVKRLELIKKNSPAN